MLEVPGSHISLLVAYLRLITLLVSEEELPVGKKVLHGDQRRVRDAVTDSLVAVSAGVFGDSGCVDGIVLTTGKAHGVLDSGRVVHPEEHVQFLACHGYGIDVATRIFRADEHAVKGHAQRLQRCPEGFLEGSGII